MNLTDEQMLAISQYSFVRMDGAWFMGVAKKFGIDAAWEMDVEAWKQFAYLLGKKIRSEYIPEPVWPESFIDTVTIFSRIVKMEGRTVIIEGNSVIVRVTDCETQKAIAKAGIADCGIVTVESYRNIVRGLFQKDIEIDVFHSKNLNHKDDCCEVVITKK